MNPWHEAESNHRVDCHRSSDTQQLSSQSTQYDSTAVVIPLELLPYPLAQLATKAPPSGNGASLPPSPWIAEAATALFFENGEVWTFSFGGITRHLRPRKGYQLIRNLILYAGRYSTAIEMLGVLCSQPADHPTPAINPHADGLSVVDNLGDSGEPIDEQAANDYAAALRKLRPEIADLEQQLEEATQLNDFGRQQLLRETLEQKLNEQLSIAAELKHAGRDARGKKIHQGRKVTDHAERARQLVRKNIRAALDALEHAIPELAKHLSDRIITGRSCIYIPDPENPLRWGLGAPVNRAFRRSTAAAANRRAIQ